MLTTKLPVAVDKPSLFSRRHQLSIRLVLATFIYSVLIATVVSGIQIYWVYHQGVESAREKLKQIEFSYIPSINAGLWEVNNARVDALLKGISELPHIGFVQLIDETGKQWQRNAPASNHPLLTQRFTLKYTEGNINFNLGELYVECTRRDVLANLRNRGVGIAITSSITLLLSGLVILLLFQRWVTRHLEKMAEFAQQLDLNNLDKPLELNRRHDVKMDELDVVVNAINQMQETLKKDVLVRMLIEQELRLHRDNLELLVELRTTELLEKNQLLEDQAKELNAQNQELDAYAQSVAHDLKTPLTTIIARAKLLSTVGGSFTPEQTQDSVSSIHRTAQKMNSIIGALLLLASIRRREEVSLEAVDMKTIIEEACGRLQQQAQDRDAAITFVGEFHNALGYAPWLEEVWINYLSNAIKYGGTPLRIEIGCDVLSTGHNKYWIRDFGEGIAPERQSKLFIPFSRIAPTSAEGHGLGLSIVKRIIERLKGEVGYHRAIDGGGYFWFTLPKAE